MRAVIVDDEPLARKEIARLLRDHDWIHVVGEAASVDAAVETIETLRPDLVFLDIQMPGGTGFDVLTRLDHMPRVIFTTAFDSFAVRAFEVNALDYLLKPIEPERMAAALAKARPSPAAETEENLEEGLATRLFVKDGAKAWFVRLDEVRLIEADGNYARIYWHEQSPMLLRSLAALEPRLDSKRFFRASRKHIVNMTFIERVGNDDSGGLIATLRGGHTVEISRRQARAFRAMRS